MKAFPSFTLGLALVLSAPGVFAHHDETHTDAAEPASHPLRGVVTQVLTEKKLVLIKHEEIPGFMKAMTMAFHVPDDIFAALTPGTPVVGLMPPKRKDGWHLTDVRVVASPGSPLRPGIPYRITLAAGADKAFAGTYAFSPDQAGDWRVCVSQRVVWVDLIPEGGEPVASKACTHANPAGFAKGPLYPLEAGKTYAVRLIRAPEADVDLLILPFAP